jgi:two-component system KDP operon response regulator KdpE
MARIRAAQRRVSPASRLKVVRTGELAVDFETRSVTIYGEPVRLSPKEYDLLRTLAEHAGRVVTHRRLLLAGWGDPETDQQYLRSYIALLRQKIEEDPAEPRLLLSEPGVGYKLSAD